MDVIPSAFGAHFQGKTLYDVDAFFLIVNPRGKMQNAAYSFSKFGSKAPKKLKETDFIGSDDMNVAEKKPYHWDSFAAGIGESVEAELSLAVHGRGQFTVTIARPKKKADHTIDLTFQGDAPEWLLDEKARPGKLMMFKIKDFGKKAK